MDVQWAILSIATSSLAHFLLRIILGRQLGPEGLGVYTLAFTIFLIGVQFSAFGIGTALSKFVSEFCEDRPTINKYVSSGMSGSVITGTVMGVVVLLLAPFLAISVFHTPELVVMIQLTAFCFPFIAMQKAVLGTLNGLSKMNLYGLLSITQNIALVAVSIVLVLYFDMGVMGAVIGYVAPTIIIGALCPIIIRKFIRINSSLWDTQVLRTTFVFGFYIVLANSIAYLNTQMDSIFIGYFMTPTDVGIFAVAVLIGQTLTLIPSAVSLVTLPAMSKMYGRGDIKGIRNLFYSTIRKNFIISMAIMISIAILGPYIISTIFGEEYLSSYIPLLLLLPGYAIGSSYVAVGGTLPSIGKVHIPFRISAITAVLAFLLDILLIPPMGLIGAAIATSISQIFNFVLRYIITVKCLKDEDKAVILPNN